MFNLKGKKLVLSLSLGLFAVLVLTGLSCSLFSTASKLADTAAQKSFISDAQTAFGKEDAYMIEGSGTWDLSGEQEIVTLSMKVNGDDFEMNLDSTTYKMNLIMLGDDTYLGVDNEWLKMGKSTSDSFASSFTSIKDDMGSSLFTTTDTDWTSGKITYVGLEKVGGVDCQKFTIQDTGTIWIGAKDKLVRQLESTQTGSEGTFTFTYENVTISAPSNFTDISAMTEEEQAMQLYTLLAKMMTTQ